MKADQQPFEPRATVSSFTAWVLMHRPNLKAALVTELETMRRNNAPVHRVEQFDADLRELAFYARMFKQQGVFGSESSKVVAVADVSASAREISATEAAGMLGVTPQRVGQLVGRKNGELTGRKVAGRWLVDIGSVEALIAKRTELGAA